MRFKGEVKGVHQLRKKLAHLPRAARKEIGAAMDKSVRQGTRVARSLAPVKTGATRDAIIPIFTSHGRVSRDGKIVGAITATDKKAWPIEFGRKNPQGKDGRSRGTTDPRPFILPTQQLLAKTHPRRMRTAIRKALRTMREE